VTRSPTRPGTPAAARPGKHRLPPPKVVPPPCLRGFENINRFWDGNVRAWTAQILPGEFYVTTRPNEIITTVLGSCVAACIRDPIMSVGGMNHFMLPEAPSGHPDGASARYGGYAIERLINEILKHGGRRNELELKIFGGGRIIEGLSDIGESNISFVRNYADAEGIAIVAEDVGARFARRVRYHAHSGHVAVKRLPMLEAREVVSKEQQLRQRLAQQAKGGDVELF
jgi:chemotaxis protein CheD